MLLDMSVLQLNLDGLASCPRKYRKVAGTSIAHPKLGPWENLLKPAQRALPKTETAIQ